MRERVSACCCRRAEWARERWITAARHDVSHRALNIAATKHHSCIRRPETAVFRHSVCDFANSVIYSNGNITFSLLQSDGRAGPGTCTTALAHLRDNISRQPSSGQSEYRIYAFITFAVNALQYFWLVALPSLSWSTACAITFGDEN